MSKRAATILFLLACFIDAAFAQSNPNCFNATMLAADIVAACNQTIAADARHAQAHLSRGIAWYRMGDYDRAIDDFSDAINIDPKYIQAFYRRGLAWEQKGKLDNALTDFRYFANLDPTYADTKKAIERVIATQRKKADLSQGAQTGRALDQNAGASSGDQTRCHRARSPQDKLSVCSEAIKADPTNPTLWYLRGNAWLESHDAKRALKDYDEAIRIDPRYTLAYDRRGTMWFDKGDYDRAIVDYNEQIRLDPKSERGYGNRALAWERKGDFDRAIEDFATALARSPKNDLLYGFRGRVWASKGDYDRAVSDFNEALRINPNSKTAYDALGNLWTDKGDFDRAIENYDKAIKIDPKSVSSYNNRGNASSMKGDYDRAIADYSVALKLDPRQAEPFFNRGRAWERKKDLQQALADYGRSVEVDPSFAAGQRGVLRTRALLDSLSAKSIEEARQEGRREAEIQFEMRTSKGGVASLSDASRQQVPVVSIPKGRRVALVVGNDSYRQVAPLEKAVGDADVVSRTLRMIGFSVIEGKDLTFEQTAKLVAEFEQGISKSDIVFFHFSGHGVQIKGDNILLPIDTPQPKDGQQGIVQKYGLSAESVIQGFNERGASLVVAVLDACRDNPFTSKGTRGIGGTRGLAALNPVEGTFVFYSAGVNQMALDKLDDADRSPTSVFTRVFTPLLQEPNLSLIDMAKRAQVGVRNLARSVGHEQTPAYYDQVIGNVGLVTQQ